MTSRLSRTGRAAAAAVIALATTATLSGCLGQTPMTLRDYTPGDGVSLRLGDLDAQALVVLTAAEGEPGTIVGALRNVGARDLSVTIGLPDSVTEVEVPAGSSVLLGPQQVEVALAAVPAQPGSLVEVVVAADAAGSGSVAVPVLDGTLAEYADLVPSS